MEKITLFGAHVSPYVRKTRVVLSLKNISYAHVPVVPFNPQKPEEFVKHSPLGKIPLLKAGDHYIADSSVICAYLDRAVPSPELFPSDTFDIAKAQWLEEYADSHMIACIGGHLFAERVLAKAIFQREPNQADIDKAINEEIPDIFDYLSEQLSGDFLVGDQLSIADIAVCSVFVAMHHSGVFCDEQKWPTLAAYINRITHLDFFKKVIDEEKMIIKALQGK